ncbi:MAG: cofactor assembly of complex C subunit B [Symploca sp. SIO2G7]|nr:cofactor assembly of complex C subunit B [Symploca sp. SIO2G7]
MLLGVGLFFFIKAATKDRTEVAEFSTELASDRVHQALIDYFQDRAYRLKSKSLESQTDSWVTLVGTVRPSVFLAIFLSLLTAVALMCFALVLATLFSNYGAIFFALVALSPLTAIVYWKQAKREEQIAFRIRHTKDSFEDSCILTLRGHRDEIIQLKANAPFKFL